MPDGAAAGRVAEPVLCGGLTALTTIDFPDRLSAVIFCQGCPWRCPYCQNPGLISSTGAGRLSWAEVVAFLERRRGLLEAVVFSGGEPTLQAGLATAAAEVKAMGFLVGLHTAGPYPRRLAAVLPLLDWVGMDVKAVPGAYPRLTGAPGSGARALASARLILESGIAHEFRTTVDPRRLGEGDVLEIGRLLAELGARRYVLQEMRCQTLLCPDPVPAGRFTEIRAVVEGPLSHLFPDFSVRAF